MATVYACFPPICFSVSASKDASNGLEPFPSHTHQLLIAAFVSFGTRLRHMMRCLFILDALVQEGMLGPVGPVSSCDSFLMIEDILVPFFQFVQILKCQFLGCGGQHCTSNVEVHVIFLSYSSLM